MIFNVITRRGSIPPSVLPPPPHHRRSGGGDSNMFDKQQNTSASEDSRTNDSRRCNEKNPSTIDSLPDELLLDILVVLPADFLYDNARLVCRKWSRIIHSQDFIAKQILHATSYGLLLSPPYSSFRCHPIYVSYTQGRIQTTELSYNCRTCFSGSCNGLAMERPVKSSEDLYLINPTTKQRFLLPSVKRAVDPRYCGIAYSAASMEYKVTVPVLSRTEGLDITVRVLNILTVGVDKSWRSVETGPLHLCFWTLLSQPPLTTDGFLHWGRSKCVSTLNVETEVFTRTQLPLPSQGLYYYLSTGRSLSLLRDCQDHWWEVWEPRLESGECRKMVSFYLNLNKILPGSCSLQLTSLKPLGWVKYPEVLAFSYRDWTCVFYNLDKHEISKIDLPAPCRALAHRNNLVWLS